MCLSIVSTIRWTRAGVRPRLEVETRPIPRRAGPERDVEIGGPGGELRQDSAATASFSRRSCGAPRRTSTRSAGRASSPPRRAGRVWTRAGSTLRGGTSARTARRAAPSASVSPAATSTLRGTQIRGSCGARRVRAAARRGRAPRRATTRPTPQDEERRSGATKTRSVCGKPVVRDPDHIGHGRDPPVELVARSPTRLVPSSGSSAAARAR